MTTLSASKNFWRSLIKRLEKSPMHKETTALSIATVKDALKQNNIDIEGDENGPERTNNSINSLDRLRRDRGISRGPFTIQTKNEGTRSRKGQIS
jgi:hypothetical protein